MFKALYTPEGIHFQVTHDGITYHFKEWEATDDCIYYMPLSNLTDNCLATYDKTGCFVPYESIYLLDDYDRQVLGLPHIYDKAIRLRSHGMLNSSDITYHIDFLTYVPDGKEVGTLHMGSILKMTDGSLRMLNEDQYKLIKLVSDFNQKEKEAKTFNFNLIEFGKIKEVANNAKVELDSYLSNENVFIPKVIDLEIGKDGDDLTVMPSVRIDTPEKFKSAFQIQKRVRDVYSLSDEAGRRTRIPLSDSQKESLNAIKQCKGRYGDRKTIEKIINDPSEIFDSSIFDLQEFYSDRVIDLGFYTPKFSPFVSPYKSAWIPQAYIENLSDGTSLVKIEDFDQLEQLEQAIVEAKEAGKTIVQYNEVKMAMEDAVFLADFSGKQLANPRNKVKIETDEKGRRKILIIEENVEETRYAVDAEVQEKDTLYTFRSNPNLSQEFSLKTHQEEGIAWLQGLMESNEPGCLLADDMGLGKTLQILYFIDWHARTHPMHNPYLIVAPVSLLENWENEYAKFFTRPMDVLRLYSKDVPRKMDTEIIRRMQDCDLILTNYETIRNAQLNFGAVNFDIIVIDEAQKIKTPGTLATSAIKALKGNFRIALTGTPVENSLIDLWCIMDYCVPGLLGNLKEFKKKYVNRLSSSDTDVKAIGDELHDKLGQYFMRRLKTDVAKDLPNKEIIRKPVHMPKVQEMLYRQVLSAYQPDEGNGILGTIQHLRSISEHPYLYDKSLVDDSVAKLIENAARLQATMKFLEDIHAKDEKVIIFTERRESQSMLQRIIRQTYGYTSKVINGDTPTTATRLSGKQSRQEAIDEFQSKDGFGVIIMSPVAAGMGLNVTAANHVIHYSRHWNPAKENQATDRAYRIGQTMDVYVYYPLAIHKDFQSFDITLDQLLARKSDLASSTIFPTEKIEVRPEEFEGMLRL